MVRALLMLDAVSLPRAMEPTSWRRRRTPIRATYENVPDVSLLTLEGRGPVICERRQWTGIRIPFGAISGLCVSHGGDVLYDQRWHAIMPCWPDRGEGRMSRIADGSLGVTRKGGV